MQEFAHRMGITEDSVKALIAGDEPVTDEAARRLEAVLGMKDNLLV